ncbi:MAG TPA: hypothetical protein VGB16_05855 [candidate division Zixibacteria bacterium]
MRREVPIAITAVVGIIFLMSYFTPHFPLNVLHNSATDIFMIIAAFSILLGVLNLVRVNLEKISKKKRDWPFSIVLILGLLVMTIVGLGFSKGRNFMELGTNFRYLYDYVYNPLSATMFSILAFFIASASYRAFRGRNLEATLLLVAAFVVMLGRVPIGYYLSSWLPTNYHLGDAASWIMNVPQKAGQRAIMIGIALGVVSTSIRIILGLERTYLGGE